jgi:predicted dinucleotide-binding enzyme
MRIAIVGAGNIGGTLGAKWAAAGHSVVFGVRDPQSPKARASLSAAGPGAAVTSVAEALEGAEVVLLSLPGAAVAALVREHGAALDGKLVIDATNQFGRPVMNGIAAIQAAAPGARVVRAFNSLGWENFAEPTIDGVQVDLLYCAPAAEAQAAERLIADVGLRPVRVGELAQAPLVDSIGALWGALVFGQGHSRRLAFKLLAAG